MSDFGGRLRQARERRGLSLQQIAATTKIAAAALEALERNDVSKLPGGIFSRAFVRAYAIEVGLDPGETVREFLERFERGRGPASGAGAAPAAESSFESQQRIANVVLKLILVSLPLIGIILYFTLRDRPVKRADVAADAAASTPAAGTQPDRPVPQAPAAVERTAPTAGQIGAMRLELRPTGACWVTLTIDGRRVLSRLIQAGEREAYDVGESAVISVGDAGAFGFWINGRPGRSLGGAGQVRTARITRETLDDYIQ